MMPISRLFEELCQVALTSMSPTGTYVFRLSMVCNATNSSIRSPSIVNRSFVLSLPAISSSTVVRCEYISIVRLGRISGGLVYSDIGAGYCCGECDDETRRLHGTDVDCRRVDGPGVGFLSDILVWSG